MRGHVRSPFDRTPQASRLSWFKTVFGVGVLVALSLTLHVMPLNSWMNLRGLSVTMGYRHSFISEPTVNFSKNSTSDTNVERLKIKISLVGTIWPRLVNETEDRILNQINYMERYKSFKNGTELPMKTILRVGDFNFYHWYDGQEKFIREKCPIDRCFLVRDYAHAKTAHALVISEFDWSKRSKFLPKPPGQIWIAQHMECPTKNRINPSSVGDLINWTASYRRDSTVPFNYGQFDDVKPKLTVNAVGTNYAKGKSKLVAWYVSNCHASNNRMGYAKKLSRHIQVDIYGKCGKLKCPRFSKDCSVLLQRDYKFYLAFENSNCKDYITEKLFTNAYE